VIDVANEGWASILKAVRNPLGFFALALLVVEAAIGAIAAYRLEDQDVLWALVLMAVLFVVITGLVAVIAFLETRTPLRTVRRIEEHGQQ